VCQDVGVAERLAVGGKRPVVLRRARVVVVREGHLQGKAGVGGGGHGGGWGFKEGVEHSLKGIAVSGGVMEGLVGACVRSLRCRESKQCGRLTARCGVHPMRPGGRPAGSRSRQYSVFLIASCAVCTDHRVSSGSIPT